MNNAEATATWRIRAVAGLAGEVAEVRFVDEWRWMGRPTTWRS